jgi:hypothetical protein
MPDFKIMGFCTIQYYRYQNLSFLHILEYKVFRAAILHVGRLQNYLQLELFSDIFEAFKYFLVDSVLNATSVYG